MPPSSFPLSARLSGARWLLWPAAGILAFLLFAGDPGYLRARSLAAAWDLGHVVAFSLWSRLLLDWKPVKEASARRQWAYLLLFSLVAGGATEGIQALTGRDASLGDLLRDLLGGVTTLAWFAPSTATLARGTRRGLRGLCAVLLLVALAPLGMALADEAIGRARFPILADFRTPFEMDRWEGGARITRVRSAAPGGKSSLRVDMDTSPYSGIALVHFPGDWRRYRFLCIDVFNPSPESLGITCRVHDRRHEEGEYRYEDRFNRELRLPPGWTRLRFDLKDAARAPAGRLMNLGEIRMVGLFATRLPAPRTMFIGEVRLE